jgi:hypothetical protein
MCTGDVVHLPPVTPSVLHGNTPCPCHYTVTPGVHTSSKTQAIMTTLISVKYPGIIVYIELHFRHATHALNISINPS